MSGEPPMGGEKAERTPAEASQPELEIVVQERRVLFKTIEHLIGKDARDIGAIHLLPYVDPGAFSKPPANMPKPGTDDYRKMEDVVNSPYVLPDLLDRLGFLARIPRSGKVKLSKDPWPEDAEKQVAWEKGARDRIAVLREAGSEDLARNQEEALEKFLAAAKEGKRINMGKIEFLNERSVESFRNAMDRGLNPRFYAEMTLLKEEGFSEQIVPLLQVFSSTLTQEVAAISHIEGLTADRLSLAKRYATYLLGRVGEEHVASTRGWQTRLATILAIATTYNLARLSLSRVDVGGAQKSEARVIKADRGGERFLRFVAHFLGSDRSKLADFPSHDPVAASNFRRDLIPEPQNPIYLLRNALNLQSSVIPKTELEVQNLEAALAARRSARAELRQAEAAFVPTIAQKPFTAGLKDYVALRKKYDKSYQEPPTLSETAGTLLKFRDPDPAVIEKWRQNLASRAKEAGFKGLALEVDKLKPTIEVANALPADAFGPDSITRGIAFASARILVDKAQRELTERRRALDRFGTSLGDNPVLAELQKKALIEVVTLQDGFSKVTNQINAYFDEVEKRVVDKSMRDMDVLDPKKTMVDGKMQIVRWKDRQEKESKEVRQQKARQPKQTAMEKRVAENMKDPKKSFAEGLRLVLGILDVPGFEIKEKKSPAHAVNILDALHKGLTESPTELSPELKTYKALLDTILVPLRLMRDSYDRKARKATLPQDSKVTPQILEAIYKRLQ